jgi:hypothetical protein
MASSAAAETASEQPNSSKTEKEDASLVKPIEPMLSGT